MQVSEPPWTSDNYTEYVLRTAGAPGPRHAMVINGLGVDAPAALRSYRSKPKTPEQHVAYLRAIFKQFVQLLINGTVRRDHQGRQAYDIPTDKKLHVQLIITETRGKDGEVIKTKARIVGRRDPEVAGVHYSERETSMSNPSSTAITVFTTRHCA